MAHKLSFMPKNFITSYILLYDHLAKWACADNIQNVIEFMQKQPNSNTNTTDRCVFSLEATILKLSVLVATDFLF